MDQDSFRKLLHSSASTPKPAGHVSDVPPKAKKAKSKKAEPSKPEFKPRTVKKQADRYRDRAEERRLGVAHDYAEVEALAEDFERRNADQDRALVEEQRRYLGGDSEHTVLVKGLDFALLEQNRVRAAAATEDDEVLEQAFAEASQTKKRTREDIVRELKNKRLKGEATPEDAVAPATDASLEDAKKAGKFRPIGFKPIGSTEGKRKKKAKAKESKVGSKKKATEIKSDVGYDTSKTEIAGPSQQTEVTSTSKPAPPPPAEPEPEEEDIDIFAGVGEYTGIDLGDDDDEPSEGEVSDRPDEPSDVATAREEPLTRAPWFDTEDEHEPSRRPSTPPPASKSKSPSEPPLAPAEDLEEGEEQEAHAHLVPLASSAIPSIREFLAAEEEKEKREKRKAKRDKKKGKAVTGGDVSD